jgi:hypothetical protein
LFVTFTAIIFNHLLYYCFEPAHSIPQNQSLVK